MEHENEEDSVTALSSDTEVSCIAVTSQMGNLTTSSSLELSTATGITVTAPVCTSTVSIVTDVVEEVSVSFQNAPAKSVMSHSTTVLGIRQQASDASLRVIYSTAKPLSPTSQNTTVLGNPNISGYTSVLGHPSVPATETVSVREYCQAFEQWAWQYYWWMMHVHWMGWAAQMSVPPVSCIPLTSSVTQTAVPPAARRVGFQQQQPARQQQPVQPPRGRECRIPSLSRRVTAEFIDFLLVFSVKLAVSIVAVEYGFDLFQSVPAADVETLLTMNWDPNVALSITSELVVMEVINRVFICIFESICLSLVGATPGKRMLGIRVIACTELVDLPANRIRILPAGNIDLGNAVVRSVIKNFSLAFFFPVCLTVFFFTHNRTGYDIISSSIVVELPEDDLWAAQPNRR